MGGEFVSTSQCSGGLSLRVTHGNPQPQGSSVRVNGLVRIWHRGVDYFGVQISSFSNSGPNVFKTVPVDLQGGLALTAVTEIGLRH